MDRVLTWTESSCSTPFVVRLPTSVRIRLRILRVRRRQIRIVRVQRLIPLVPPVVRILAHAARLGLKASVVIFTRLRRTLRLTSAMWPVAFPTAGAPRTLPLPLSPRTGLLATALPSVAATAGGDLARGRRGVVIPRPRVRRASCGLGLHLVRDPLWRSPLLFSTETLQKFRNRRLVIEGRVDTTLAFAIRLVQEREHELPV